MLQKRLSPRLKPSVIAIGLFKKKLATITKTLGVRFNPKNFFGRKIILYSFEFSFSHNFFLCYVLVVHFWR